jgi:hypothetical protein
MDHDPYTVNRRSLESSTLLVHSRRRKALLHSGIAIEKENSGQNEAS